jgi:hypothetical protein
VSHTLKKQDIHYDTGVERDSVTPYAARPGGVKKFKTSVGGIAVQWGDMASATDGMAKLVSCVEPRGVANRRRTAEMWKALVAELSQKMPRRRCCGWQRSAPEGKQ